PASSISHKKYTTVIADPTASLAYRDDSDLKDLVFPCPSPYAFLNSDILNPGEVSLLAIAPLTNIAMAIKKDPSITDKIKHLYIIGGTNNALGNIVPAAEYNFYVDPEAAKLVLQSGIEMTMVGWDMCTDYSLMFDKEHEEIEALATKGAKFFTDVNRVVKKFNREVHKLDGTTHPDTLLVAIAADDKIMSQSNKYFVDVETKGELTRGYSLVDINGRLGKEPNVRVCEKV